MLDLTISKRVAWITLSRPPVNALNDQFIAQFHALLDQLELRDDWGVLAIVSNQKVFCAGADLAQIEECINTPEGADRMVEIISQFQSLFLRIETLNATSIAVISGAALGGGLELALACDLRIAANEAKLGLPEASLGVIPGAGGTQRLTQLCGKGIASRLILGAEIINGQEAQQLSLVQWSVPRSDLALQSQELAERLAQLDRSAIDFSKQCIAAASRADVNGFTLEIEATRTLYKRSSTRERIGAFLNKSKK
ncbi:MAG: enoyl-CoA hydratase/isomerase family protein [Zwartia sp.]